MTATGPKRRPAEGGYARGEETRLRIIRTAIPLFGEQGYEGASTREIAAEAGVNPPALQYYFDGKDGLYCACAEHIAEQAIEAIGPALARADELLAQDAPTEALIEGYCAIMDALSDLVLCREGSATWSRMLAREQAGMGPGLAFPVFRERFLDRLHAVCCRLLGRISGLPADAQETRLRMMTIKGQLMAFHIGRGSALACLGWPGITLEQGVRIKSIIVEQTRALLNAAAAQAG
jgi:AcrR family transcriptional regulator